MTKIEMGQGVEIDTEALDRRVKAAQREIAAICAKYGVALQGIVKATEIRIVPILQPLPEPQESEHADPQDTIRPA